MSLFRATTVIIVLSLGLSSCAGISERREQRRAAEAAEDHTRCTTKGFRTGTDAFLLCLDNSSILRQNENAARIARKAANDKEWDEIFNTDD